MLTILYFETSGTTYPVGSATSQKTRIPITYPAEVNIWNKYRIFSNIICTLFTALEG
jgi:hypothetical protein